MKTGAKTVGTRSFRLAHASERRWFAELSGAPVCGEMDTSQSFFLYRTWLLLSSCEASSAASSLRYWTECVCRHAHAQKISSSHVELSIWHACHAHAIQACSGS